MIKTLRFPEITNEFVDINAVTSNFKGVMLVYSNDNPIGYITYVEPDWCFCTNINSGEQAKEDKSDWELWTVIKAIQDVYSNVRIDVICF